MSPLYPIALATLVTVSAVPAGAARLDELVSGAIAFHNEVSSHTLAVLGSKRVSALLDGEIVVLRRRTRDDHGDNLDWVFAYALDTQPRTHLWLAATRPGASDSDDFTSIGVERQRDGNTLTFMHMDLPWPMDDRWWLATVTMDVELAEASGGRIWARRWCLADDGTSRATELASGGQLGRFTPANLESGTTLPTNEGAFLVFDLDGTHTLIAYASLISAGGAVPDGFFAEFSSRTLRRNIARIRDEAASVPEFYAGDAPLCTDGFGQPIPRFDAGRPSAPVTAGGK